MAAVFLFLILALLKVTNSAYSPGANKFCLFCQNVQNPYECTQFVQVWQHEVCTTERLLLFNGTTVWTMGYEPEAQCHGDEIIPARRRRASRASTIDVTVCHECCYTDMCNHNLCGSISNNSLACLRGDAIGHPPDTSVGYCNHGELCYVSQSAHSRPGQFQYDCVSQLFCHSIPDNNPHGSCQKCCNSDGCNAHACTVVPIFTDCWDLRTRGGFTQDGVYDIYPPLGNARIRVRCDMTTAGGGWVVFHRRYDGSLSFANRTLNDYAEGFGDLSREFWLGLDHVYQVTSHSIPLVLRVDVCRGTNLHGSYSEYNEFSIANRNDNFRLHIGSFLNGGASDGLADYNADEFTVTSACAMRYGAWWYRRCRSASLNHPHFNTGLYWAGSRSAAEMKIRPMLATRDSTRYTCPYTYE